MAKSNRIFNNVIPKLGRSAINNRITKRSARNLAREHLDSSISKPIFTDNWDLVFEYDLSPLRRLFSKTGPLFNPTNLAKGLALKTFLKDMFEITKDITSQTVNFYKLSAKIQSVSLPVYKVTLDKIRYGPLRYNYPIDYNYDDFSMTIREDESDPVLPFFENLKFLQFNPDGTLNESAFGKMDGYFSLYSDYEGISFITIYLRGLRVESITIGEGSLNRTNPAPLVYTVKFALDNMSLSFNQLNPLVNLLGSNSISLDKFLTKGSFK